MDFHFRGTDVAAGGQFIQEEGYGLRIIFRDRVSQKF